MSVEIFEFVKFSERRIIFAFPAVTWCKHIFGNALKWARVIRCTIFLTKLQQFKYQQSFIENLLIA